MSYWDFLMGRPDYDARARRFLNIIEDDVKENGKELKGDFHKSILNAHIKWIKSDYPKEAKPWVEATKRRCDIRYPGLL